MLDKSRVTLHDVADLAGVSHQTVSRVVNKNKGVRPGTRERVEAAILELGYRPNAIARSMVQGNTHTLGCISPNLTDPVFTRIIESAQAEARRLGFFILIGSDAAKELLYHPERFTAIFAQNDRMAAGAIRTLRDAGFQVPEDYSMIGYDNGPLATLIDPILTTIQQPLEDFGELAAQILIQAIQQNNLQPVDYCTTPELIIRQSTANYHK